DFHVTGVQTCALPILCTQVRKRHFTCPLRRSGCTGRNRNRARNTPALTTWLPDQLTVYRYTARPMLPCASLPSITTRELPFPSRSEERRVGTDRRSR